MPNQDSPVQNPNPISPPINKPADQTTTPPVAPIIFPQSDLPPLSPDFQNMSGGNTADAPSQPNIPSIDSDAGSGAPPDAPSVISKPKKKFGGGKIIATILSILLIVGGVGAGIYLVGQQQLFVQKASAPGSLTICHSTGADANPYIVNHPDKTGDAGGHDIHNGPIWYSGIAEAWGDIIPPFDYESGHYGGKNWNTYGEAFFNNNCNKPAAPSCIEISAYDNTWAALTDTQFSALTVGDIVNFCVNGEATYGTFDKAQFMINTTIEPEVTAHTRPGSTDFCQSYTILSTDTTINVKAKIYHSSGVWVGENF
jgi:hypothetical protein